MPNVRVHSPEWLREKIETLRSRRGRLPKATDRHVAIIEALAEAYFRLGVHPDTPIEEALQCLRKAHRLDATNPRYAYHLARIYFTHGELDRAANWLMQSFDACPTSHRIWTHISLLMRALNRRYERDTEYEHGVLTQRAKEISEHVRNGADVIDLALLNFKPPRSLAKEEEEARLGRKPAGNPLKETSSSKEDKTKQANKKKSPRTMPPRFQDAGCCRWTGVVDLEVEHQLSANKPSRRTRDTAIPLLEHVATLRTQRRGGDTAFVVLAIQWIVSGYSVGTIRRLLSEMNGLAQGESLQLLKCVCDIWEADADSVPGLLNEALSQDRLPPLLAAIIHKKRVLWLPVQFRATERYRVARALVRRARRGEVKKDNGLTQQITELQRALNNALRDFTPEPPKPIDDATAPKTQEPSESSGSGSTDEPLAQLIDRAQEIQMNIDAHWDRLRELTEVAKKGDLDEAQVEEGLVLVDFANSLGATCENALDQLAQIRASGAVTDIKSLDKLEEDFRQFRTRARPFKKRATKLKLPEVEAAPAPTSATEVTDSTDREKAAKEDPPENTGSLAGLAKTLKKVDSIIRDRFLYVQQSFKAYSKDVLLLPDMQALQTMVYHQQAEAFYRLGRRPQARRLWTRIVQGDWLCVEAHKNIAVCDTGDIEVSRYLSSWQAYVEVLYFYDIILGSPRPHAKRRGDFHRDFSSAYAPVFLTAALDADWSEKANPESWAAFLNSPSRVRTFTDHKLLEFWNRKFDFTCPTLVVGTGRCENNTIREKARDAMLEIGKAMLPLLPKRVRERFTTLACEHIENAFARSEPDEARTLKRNPNYQEEEECQRHWVQDILHLKYKILALLNKDGWQPHIASIDFMEHIGRLDAFPIDLSPSILAEVAQSLGRNPEALLERLNNLREVIVFSLLGYIFKDTGKRDADKETLRQRQYRRLVDDWVHEDSIGDYLERIDDPQHCYPECVREALSALGSEQENAVLFDSAIAILKRWCEDYVELTSPARYLAFMLLERGRGEEAIPVLETAIAKGFYDEGREQCRKSLIQVRIRLLGQKLDNLQTQEACQDAMGELRDIIREAPEIEALGSYISHIYNAWIQVNPKSARRLVEPIFDDHSWYCNQAKGKVSEEELSKVRHNQSTLMVNAAIAPYQKDDGGIDEKKWPEVVRSISDVLDREPDNTQALRLRMMGRFQTGMAIVNTDRARAKPHIYGAADDARRLLKLTDDDTFKKDAAHVIRQAEQLSAMA